MQNIIKYLHKINKRWRKQNSQTTKISDIRFAAVQLQLSGALSALKFNDFPTLWQILQLPSLRLAITGVDISSTGREEPENLFTNFIRTDVCTV
jgi:hypothetical protein